MNINSIKTIGYYYAIGSMKRSAAFTALTILSPLSILFLFYLLSGSGLSGGIIGNNLIQYAILGGFISIVAGNSLGLMYDAAWWRIQLKIQDLLVATQISETDYMFGLGLSSLIYSLPGIAIYLTIAYASHIFTVYSFAITALVLFILSISTTSVGFILSSIPRHMRNTWGMTGIASLLLAFIPPIFYPYTILPKPLLYIFLISPTTSASIILQGITGLQPMYTPAIYVLIIEVFAFVLLTKRFTKWRQD